MTRNGGVHSFVTVGLALCLSVGIVSSVSAGLLFPGNAPHPNAVAGGSASVPLLHDADNNPITPNEQYGDLEYAVFTAAGFGTAFPGEDTPNGGVANGEFVYAFQIINNGRRGDITQFSAGLADIGPPLNPFHFGDNMDDKESVEAGDQDFIAGTGQAPSSSLVIPSVLHAPSGSSVRFNFNTGTAASRINTAESSAVLFYTSPWAPGFDNASTTTGQGQSRVPAPEEGRLTPFVPEPSSMALMVMALAGLALRRTDR